MNTEVKANHGTVEGMTDKLVQDLKTVVGDGNDLMKGLAHSTVQEFAATRTKISGKLDEARSRLDGARTAVAERASGAADATHDYVVGNPWKVLAVVMAAGLLIGAFFSRRE